MSSPIITPPINILGSRTGWASSPVPHALHANLILVDEPGGAILRRSDSVHHREELCLDARISRCDHHLPGRPQRQPSALPLEGQGRRYPAQNRRRQTRARRWPCPMQLYLRYITLGSKLSGNPVNRPIRRPRESPELSGKTETVARPPSRATGEDPRGRTWSGHPRLRCRDCHCLKTIGIGGSFAAPPLPHHRAYGSVHGGSVAASCGGRGQSGKTAG